MPGRRQQVTRYLAVPRSYVHHLTDYARAARRAGLAVAELTEWFDEEDRAGVPRIVAWLFRRGA